MAEGGMAVGHKRPLKIAALVIALDGSCRSLVTLRPAAIDPKQPFSFTQNLSGSGLSRTAPWGDEIASVLHDLA